VLFSGSDNLLYIGFTTDLEKRIDQHNSGQSKSTACGRPLQLIFSELYLFEEDARKRENYFKTSMGRKAIKLMLNETLSKMGYQGKQRFDIL
jgi:putative endonuclease